MEENQITSLVDHYNFSSTKEKKGVNIKEMFGRSLKDEVPKTKKKSISLSSYDYGDESEEEESGSSSPEFYSNDLVKDTDRISIDNIVPELISTR